MRICIILARGGSKGIKNKNLQRVGKYTLVERAVKSSMESGIIDKTFVSSDSDAILDEARRSGALCIQRPSNISDDFSSSESGIIHAINLIESTLGIDVSIIFFIQVTSPFLEMSDIRRAYDKFNLNKYDSLFTGYASHKFVWRDINGNVIPLNHDGNKRRRRQDIALEVTENGALYIFSKELFLKEESRFCGVTGYYLMSEYKSLEIDSTEDLRIANILENNA